MPAPPPARPWLLLATSAAAAPPAPPGAAIARQMWDGVTPWQPPPGLAVVPDDGRPLWQPPAAPPPPASGFDALPPEVLHSIAAAALAEPRLLLALIRLLPRQPAAGDPWRAFLTLAMERTAAMDNPLTPARAALTISERAAAP